MLEQGREYIDSKYIEEEISEQESPPIDIFHGYSIIKLLKVKEPISPYSYYFLTDQIRPSLLFSEFVVAKGAW